MSIPSISGRLLCMTEGTEKLFVVCDFIVRDDIDFLDKYSKLNGSRDSP